MQTLLVLAVLSQVASPKPFVWSDGERSHKLWKSATLIAEPSPAPALREQLVAAEPKAELVVDRPTMRVWRVRDAEAVLAKVTGLRPVFHDSQNGAGRMRVPLALVCGNERVPKPWAEVLSGSGGACVPDFWYAPVLR